MNLHRRCLIAIAVLLALSNSQALAQIAFVKTIGTTPSTGNGTSLTVIVPAAGVAGGNSVIVSLGFDPASGAVSCSDSHGNSYAVDKDITNGSGKSGVRAVIFSAHNIVALTNGNTITCTHPSAGARAMSANEFSGLATSATRDQTSSGTGNSTAASSGSTPTTTQGSELLLGTIGVEGKWNESFTVGSSYTSIGRTGTNQGSAASNITINPEYRLVTTTGAYNASGTLGTSTKWASAIVTYKAVPSTATKLVITSVNGGSNPIAGTTFSVVVQAQNASGAPTNVSAATGVSLSRKTGTGTLGGMLSGTIAAGSNQTTITGVTYTKAESAVEITATRTSGDNLSPGDSASFTVNPGAANKLAFLTPSGSSTAGSVLSGPPTVAVQDSLGNTVTSFAASITVAIGTNPSGGVLSGTTSKNASGGVTSFSDLSINRAGAGYTLTASAIGLTTATSSAFNISAAAAIKVAFTTQPASANAGSAIAGPPSVTVQDNFGNTVTSSSASITIAIGTNPAGGSLSGTLTMNATSGVASFSNLSVNKSGAGYTLTASATGLTSATSGGFNIAAGAAAKLAYTTAPGNSTAGNTIAGPPSVTVQDSFGNTVTSSIASITVAIGMNPGSGTLSGTTTKNAVSGVANFNDLSVEKSGTGYTLAASATGLTGATSSAFNVSAGAANKLAFSVQPGNAGAGVALSGPPTIVVQDGFGNTVTSSTASITAAIASNPGGGVLTGTTTRNASSGVAVFTDLSIAQLATGYTLSAASSGLTSATSSAFNITAASVTLSATPASVSAGDSFMVAWGQIPTPTNRDWIGLYAPGSSDTSYIAYRYVNCSTSPTVPVASGTCSFPISSSQTPGTYEFRLLPNDTYSHIATSNSVTVTAAINKLAISVAQNITAGTPGFSMVVESRSPSGVATNVSSNTAITVSVKTGTGTLSGTLSGTIIAGTSQVTIGLATYPKAESGVVLTAARTSGDILIAGDTAPFTVSPGAAARLAFTTQPGNAAAKSTIPGPPTVTVQDNAGNTVTSSSHSISIAIETNPGAGTLSGNMTVTSNASVSFPALSINQAGNGYTLTASAAGLTSAISNPFNITSPTGTGIIAGVITRVSNGATITGALVEAFQGTALRGTAVTNSSGNYSTTGLATGTYTVRASFAGLVPQILNSVIVTSGNTTTVDLSLNFGIAVQSPGAGAMVSDFSVLVTGHFDTSLASEVGITVNGYVALQDGDEFSTFVPIDSQTMMLTATLKDTAGNLIAGDAVPITPQLPTSEPVLTFRSSPAIALVSEPVAFSLVSTNEISQIQLDANGDETIDFTGTTLDGLSVTFAEPGLYYPNVRVADTNSVVYTAAGIVQILDINQLDVLLQSKWSAMKNALRAGDTMTAASHIVYAKQAFYQNIFNNLTISFSAIDQFLPNLTLVEQWHNAVEYEITRTEGSDQVTYMVLFTIDDDGVWRIKFF